MSQLLGDVQGLKKKEIRQLEKLFQRSVQPDQFVSSALAEEIALFSMEMHQPLTVLLDRPGRVYQVFVGTVSAMGEDNVVKIPAKSQGLCGVRAISTQLAAMAPPAKSALTTVLQYYLDALVTLVVQPAQWSVQFGEHPKAADAVFISHLSWQDSERPEVVTDGPMTLLQLEKRSFEDHLEWVESEAARHSPYGVAVDKTEKAFLLGLATRPGIEGKSRAEDWLDELSLLAKTAGASIVGRAMQSRPQPDPQFYVGKGKAQELAFEIQQTGANLVIADDELSTVQQRQLERILRTRVVDRTEVILDIFAQRAQTWEGKIQVELAQLQYLLPRLTGRGASFSQQTAAARGGTIATRGPGETKLELDRRRLRTRITDLERQAESVRKNRRLQRKERLESNMPVIALVGYTNAGKSTLLNTLTQAGVLAENKLFATLDPITRRLIRPGMQPCLLVDTVGFIQKLPTTLVKAFRATLEEIQTADLILHVADLSHPDRIAHLEAVQATLNNLSCETTPQWILFNKIDTVKQPEDEIRSLGFSIDNKPVFPISAQSGEGLPEFLEALQGFLQTLKPAGASGLDDVPDTDEFGLYTT